MNDELGAAAEGLAVYQAKHLANRVFSQTGECRRAGNVGNGQRVAIKAAVAQALQFIENCRLVSLCEVLGIIPLQGIPGGGAGLLIPHLSR